MDERTAISGITDVPARARAGERTGPRGKRAPWLQIGPIREYAWSNIDLPIAGLHPELDGLRIVHLSDVHFGPGGWHPGLNRVIARIAAAPPDLICITGDLVDDKHDSRPAFSLVERLTAPLRARLGVFAILGNHDGDLLAPRLPRWGVRVITGETIKLSAGDQSSVELIGLAGVHRDDLSLEMFSATVPDRAPDSLRIVLSHYPDALPGIVYIRPDLFLAGHTHGGQICLPGGTALLTHDSLPRRFCRGTHRIGQTWLSVSRGMGYTNFPVRVSCSAEVVELRMRREDVIRDE